MALLNQQQQKPHKMSPVIFLELMIVSTMSRLYARSVEDSVVILKVIGTILRSSRLRNTIFLLQITCEEAIKFMDGVPRVTSS